MTRLIWLAAGAAWSLAACAGGGSGPPVDHTPAPPSVLLSGDALMFVSFDADQDGRISVAERDAGIVREWARADRNRDGSLTPLEFSDWSLLVLGGAQLPPYRLDFDRNVDNAITEAEFVTELRSRAEDYDANHDNAVTRAEMLRPAPGRVRPVISAPGAAAGPSGGSDDPPGGNRPPR